jgi:hypothetical protein
MEADRGRNLRPESHEGRKGMAQEMHSKERKMAPAPVAVSNEIEVLRHQAPVKFDSASACGQLFELGHWSSRFCIRVDFSFTGTKAGDGRRTAKALRAPFVSAQGFSRGLPLAGTFGRLRQSVGARGCDGWTGLATKKLDEQAPHSPTNDPKETVRSLLASISFHQAYHAGQTGLLGRVVGKPGAIA